MGSHFLRVFLATALALQVQVSGSSSTYRAAVVEYHPNADKNEATRVTANVRNYEILIREAKNKGAEIIVFPEGGLGTKEIRSYIPDPVEKVVPCDSLHPQINQVIRDLSCASKNNEIYSVINLVEQRNCAADDEFCPPKHYYVFNTNVVFDRQGMVIARYAKYNLFDEALTDRTQDPEMIFFDTDFGVRFGTFTCFDILFPAPAQRLVQQYHITDFVFTTQWFSELPFLTATQAQRGWAESNNVNLLASGVNYPARGSSGSGIYNGRFGRIVQVMLEKATTKLLVADVPKIQENACSNVCQKTNFVPSEPVETPQRSHFDASNDSAIVEPQELVFLKDPQINLYASEVIEPGNTFDKTLCSANNFCCHFQVAVDALAPDSKNYTIRAVVVNGVRKFGQTFRGGVQSCGVLLCNGPDIKNCTSRLKNIEELFKFKKITIEGNFSLRNSFQMPSTLTVGKELKPLSANKYVFRRTEKDTNAAVSLELVWPALDLQTFAIWGRDFTRDMEPQVPESGAPRESSLSFLLLSLLAFLLTR